MSKALDGCLRVFEVFREACCRQERVQVSFLHGPQTVRHAETAGHLPRRRSPISAA